MAFAISNYSLLLSPSRHPARSSSKSLSSPKSLAFSSQRSPRPKTLSSPLSRGSPRASLRVADTDPKTINEGEDNQVPVDHVDQSENKLEEQNMLTMKVLVQAYKKAIMDGDEKSVSKIEGAILLLETEKEDLSQKCKEITAEMTSGKEKLLRLKADFDNYRKRIEKDHLSLTSDVQGELIASLLPLVDSFEKAKQHLKPVTDQEKKIDMSYQGIYKQFVEIMRSLRVAVIGTVGKPFDPSIHEAVAREESQKFKEGIVMQEVRRGFVLGDHLLRPATVKVSIGPGPGKVPSAGGESSEANEDTSSSS